MKKFWKKLLVLIKKIDRTTKQYENSSKIPALPAEAFVNRGLYWAEKGELEKAKDEFERAISVANPSPDAFINMGIYYARLSQFNDAVYYFRQALKIDKYNARAYSLWASVLVELNEIEQAEKFYAEANRLSPRDADVYYNWAVALARIDKKAQAYEKLKRACFYNPLNPIAFFFWGLLLVEDKRFEEAIQKFQMTLAYAPNHKEVCHYLAYCNKELGKLKEAKFLSEKSLQIKKDWAEGYVLAAEIDLKLGLREEVLKYYNTALENGVESVSLYISWAMSLIELKRFEEAKEKSLFVLQLSPLDASSLYNLAYCEYCLNNVDSSMLYLDKLLALYSNNFNAIILQGKNYLKKGEYKSAIACFKNVVNASNKHYPLYLDIANAYNDSGDKSSAIKYYEKAIEYVPDMTPAYVNCAKVLCEVGEVKDAMRKIRKAYSLENENPFVIFTYAAVLLYDERYQDAYKKFDDVVKMNVIPEAKLGCVESLIYMNKLEDALSQLEKIKDEFVNSLSYRKLNVEVYYRLAQNTNSEYNIEQALIWCERVEELCGEDIEIMDKKIKLREMSKREQ